MIRLKTSDQNGFTIIEVGIIVPILIAVLLTLSSSLYFALQMNVAERIQASSAYDTHEALSIIEKDVSLASQFLDTKDSTVTDAYPPSSNGGVWSYLGQSATQRTLILRSYATTTNPDANDRQPVFINGTGIGCDVDSIFYNDVSSYNTMYFILNNNLYRRRALDTSKATCSTPYQVQSCPSLETLKSSTRNASCKADDELIIGDISQFSIEYYANSNDTEPIDAYDTSTGAMLIQDANAVKITVTANRKAMGKITPVTSSLLMPRINTLKTGN